MPADPKAMSADEHIAVVRDALREIGESAMYDLAGQQWTECLDCGGRNGAHFPGEPDAPGSGCHVADASAAVDELARRLSELERERDKWKRLYRGKVAGQYHCSDHVFYDGDCKACVAFEERETFFDENFA